MGVGVVGPELAARSWLLCSGELEGKRPPEACEEEGGTQGCGRGGHHVFTSENLPKCHMINPSWRLSDLLRGEEVCIAVKFPELANGRRRLDLPFS